MHEESAVRLKENEDPSRVNQFAKRIAGNVSPESFRKALQEARAAEIPFALSPMSSISNQVTWAHTCKEDEKTAFNDKGTDTIWALTGRDDKASPVHLGKCLLAAVDVVMPTGLALERATDAKVFKAVKPGTGERRL